MGQDVYVPPGFGNRTLWSELLDGWLRLVTRYENRVGLEQDFSQEQDFSYWYNESPLTGLLAAAAWELKDRWSLQKIPCKETWICREISRSRRPVGRLWSVWGNGGSQVVLGRE